MKRHIACLTVLTIVLSVFVNAQASATALDASNQIGSYYIDASGLSGGIISIAFSVTGTDIMNSIGAEKIRIYEKNGNIYQLAFTYDVNDAGMTARNTYVFGNTIHYPGKRNTDYIVDVTVFAEDSSGYDSRSKSFVITTPIY